MGFVDEDGDHIEFVLVKPAEGSCRLVEKVLDFLLEFKGALYVLILIKSHDVGLELFSISTSLVFSNS